MTSFFIPRGLRVRESDSNPSVIASELVFPNATLSVAGSAVTVQGLVVDGDKGDITVSGSGATWTIDNSVVTTAKLGGDITTAGKALLDDADAAAQRTTLGLGTLATQSGTFSGTSSGTNTGDQTNISGNAATVTTNANLTGHVTSVGNAAVLGSFTKAELDTAVSDGNVLYVGDVTSNATHSGDVTGDTALTIANAAVTLAKMANLAQDQFIGRTTASTGVPETATITAAARTVLDDATVADMVNTLGGATSTGTGGLVRATSPTLTGTLNAAAITVGDGVTTHGTLTIKNNGDDLLVVDNTSDGTLKVNATGPHVQSVSIIPRNTSGVSQLAFNATSYLIGNTFGLLISEGAATGVLLRPNDGATTARVLTISPANAANAALVINGLASQAGNLLECKVNSGSSVLTINPSGNLTASGTLRVGGGTVVANILSATATLDFGSIGSNATETLTITVTGAVAGDSVFLGCPAGLDAGLVFCASVTAADTVTVRIHNSTGGAVDPASGTFRATVIRF
jgi:hypothetical protein